jgi:hypothetical protein
VCDICFNKLVNDLYILICRGVGIVTDNELHDQGSVSVCTFRIFLTSECYPTLHSVGSRTLWIKTGHRLNAVTWKCVALLPNPYILSHHCLGKELTLQYMIMLKQCKLRHCALFLEQYKLKVTSDVNTLVFVQLNVCLHVCVCVCTHMCMHACVYMTVYQFLQLQEIRIHIFMAMDCLILILMCTE